MFGGRLLWDVLYNITVNNDAQFRVTSDYPCVKIFYDFFHSKSSFTSFARIIKISHSNENVIGKKFNSDDDCDSFNKKKTNSFNITSKAVKNY